MDLPVWNSGRPLVRQRNLELQQQLITWRQSESRAATEARTAIERYEQIRQLWLATSVDQSVGRRELTSISDAFEKGQATITEVLSTQDNLIQERQANLDLLDQLSQAAVDVVAALAIDPELVIEAPSAAAPSGDATMTHSLETDGTTGRLSDCSGATGIVRYAKPILFVVLAFCVAGTYCALTMPSSVFPQTNFPRVVILIDNGVMPADEMMANITRPVEEAMKDIPGTVNIRSATSRGSDKITGY